MHISPFYIYTPDRPVVPLPLPLPPATSASPCSLPITPESSNDIIHRVEFKSSSREDERGAPVRSSIFFCPHACSLKVKCWLNGNGRCTLSMKGRRIERGGRSRRWGGREAGSRKAGGAGRLSWRSRSCPCCCIRVVIPGMTPASPVSQPVQRAAMRGPSCSIFKPTKL